MFSNRQPHTVHGLGAIAEHTYLGFAGQVQEHVQALLHGQTRSRAVDGEQILSVVRGSAAVARLQLGLGAPDRGRIGCRRRRTQHRHQQRHYQQRGHGRRRDGGRGHRIGFRGGPGRMRRQRSWITTGRTDRRRFGGTTTGTDRRRVVVVTTTTVGGCGGRRHACETTMTA